MITFSLVAWLLTSYPSVIVSGYSSMEECRAAADALREGHSEIRAACIPEPYNNFE